MCLSLKLLFLQDSNFKLNKKQIINQHRKVPQFYKMGESLKWQNGCLVSLPMFNIKQRVHKFIISPPPLNNNRQIWVTMKENGK
jgi:hypothetical protein